MRTLTIAILAGVILHATYNAPSFVGLFFFYGLSLCFWISFWFDFRRYNDE